VIPERIAPRSGKVRGRAAATLELADAAHLPDEAAVSDAVEDVALYPGEAVAS